MRRTPEPSDAFGVVRRNHVAFLDVRDGTTETVGRAHARLQFDPASGHYLLFNEASSNPTSIVRAGKDRVCGMSVDRHDNEIVFSGDASCIPFRTANRCAVRPLKYSAPDCRFESILSGNDPSLTRH